MVCLASMLIVLILLVDKNALLSAKIYLGKKHKTAKIKKGGVVEVSDGVFFTAWA